MLKVSPSAVKNEPRSASSSLSSFSVKTFAMLNTAVDRVVGRQTLLFLFKKSPRNYMVFIIIVYRMRHICEKKDKFCKIMVDKAGNKRYNE